MVTSVPIPGVAGRAAEVADAVAVLAGRFAEDRPQRQQRRHLDPADFEALAAAGLPLSGVPAASGGLWESVPSSTRMIAGLLRTLARGDASVALVCSMHPSVLAHWLASPDAPPDGAGPWVEQRRAVTESAAAGAWWGTINSEPGSHGDIARTRTSARPGPGGGWLLTGDKHFGSGLGVTSFMHTAAVPDGESEPAYFFLDVRGVPWDGSTGFTLAAEWDGHGMAATQSHAVGLRDFPATRFAWPGSWRELGEAALPLVGCVYAAVIMGILDEAVESARHDLTGRSATLRPYEQVEWSRAELEVWTAAQAYEGMLRAVENASAPQHDVLVGKVVVAEAAESAMRRICRVVGGGTYARRSPYGFWFEDVRALGFLRPPWGLAYDMVHATRPGPQASAGA